MSFRLACDMQKANQLRMTIVPPLKLAVLLVPRLSFNRILLPFSAARHDRCHLDNFFPFRDENLRDCFQPSTNWIRRQLIISRILL